MKIDSLWIYPVKSCAGIQRQEIEVIKGGAQWDRHWMIVDDNGGFLTQRQLPKMQLIQTELTNSALVLRIDNYVFEIPFKEKNLKKANVKVWKSEVEAYEEDPLISSQLSSFLGKKVSLVRSIEEQRQHHIRFADGRPLLLTNMESLKKLNKELKSKISMLNFRPNIVISGVEAFTEDSWVNIELGGHHFEVSKACTRCSIINVDPQTGERNDTSPLVKLKELHSVDGQPAFGVYLIPKSTGTLSIN